ncbi:MAG: Ig-like domain-containing protein [Myxococcaceae bacterium]|nr:Ig-like domain-containing protein [Myxococcaceae bacterium]
MRSLSFIILCAACWALALPVGCGGDEERPDAGPPPVVDAGPDAGPPDAGPSDRLPPVVVSHSPTNGAQDVPVGSRVEVTFDEPMQTDVGSLQLLPATELPNNGTWNARPQDWDATRTKVSFSFPQGLPRGRRLVANVARFADEAGNVMQGVTSFSFTVEVGPPPRVASTLPAEGASGVPLTTSEIVITFNDAMDTTAGTLVPGGGLTLGPASWASNQVLKAPITSALVDNGLYSVRLDGFRNYLGLALDGKPTLGDGQLDFGTGPDRIAPQVRESSPIEGAMDLHHEDISFIVLTFSEPMDATAGKAEVVDGANPRTTLVPQWSDDGFTVIYDSRFKLRPNADLSVDLTGFRDRAGNPLDLTGPPAYLGANGDLDFSMAADTVKPYVTSTSLPEGSTVYPVEVFDNGGTAGYRKVFTFQFSEPMDPSNPLVTLHDVSSPGTFRSFAGQWSAGDLTLTVTITPPGPGQLPLLGDRDYYLDLTRLKDRSGNLLDVTVPPLGDGHFDFRTLLNDIDLTHACGHSVTQTPAVANATEIVTGTTPRVDQLHTRYELVLPGSGVNHSGYVRAQLVTNRSQPIFMDREVPLMVTDPGDPTMGIGVSMEAVPFACEGITHVARFLTPLASELHLKYGPVEATRFRLILEEAF